MTRKYLKIGYNLIVIFLLLCSLLIASCVSSGNSPEINDSEQQEYAETQPSIYEINFTDEELEYIRQLKNDGVLKCAAQVGSADYYPQEDGTITGFPYLLAKSFADNLGIDIHIREVDDFSDFFEIDGNIPEDVKSNPKTSYTPTLFNEVDVYLGQFTVLTWREKLMKFINTFPNRQRLVTHVDMKIDRIEDLEKLNLAILEDSSYLNRVKELEVQYDYKQYYYLITDSSSDLEEVNIGNADGTFTDSIFLFLEMTNSDNIVVNFPVSSTEELAIAVRRNNTLLASILNKYFNHIRKTGEFNQYFKSEFNITISEYLNLLASEK